MKSVDARANTILTRLGEHPSVVEVGVYDGRFSAILLAHHTLELLMVDSWGKHLDHKDKHEDMDTFLLKRAYRVLQAKAKDATGFAAGRRTMLREFSVAAAAQFQNGSFDCVFIDADHSYESVKADIRAWRHKIKDGGILCGHDYTEKFPGVKKAVDEMLGEIDIGGEGMWFAKAVQHAY